MVVDSEERALNFRNVVEIVGFELILFRFKAKLLAEEFVKEAFQRSSFGLRGSQSHDDLIPEHAESITAGKWLEDEDTDGFYPFHLHANLEVSKLYIFKKFLTKKSTEGHS